MVVYTIHLMHYKYGHSAGGGGVNGLVNGKPNGFTSVNVPDVSSVAVTATTHRVNPNPMRGLLLLYMKQIMAAQTLVGQMSKSIR